MQVSQVWLKSERKRGWKAFLGRSWRFCERCFFGSGPALRYSARETRLAEQPQGEFHAKTPSRKEVLADSLALSEKPARLVGLRQSFARREGELSPPKKTFLSPHEGESITD